MQQQLEVYALPSPGQPHASGVQDVAVLHVLCQERYDQRTDGRSRRGAQKEELNAVPNEVSVAVQRFAPYCILSNVCASRQRRSKS